MCKIFPATSATFYFFHHIDAGLRTKFKNVSDLLLKTNSTGNQISKYTNQRNLLGRLPDPFKILQDVN